jgi:YesN/AraC family two-component response regulator
VLLRKAVEQGGVHPFYIDSVSSDFAKKVEKIKSVQEGIDMMHDMIYKYCALVKNHSMKNYSLLVQKVITVIDSDLTADLSLHRQAEMLNINASYLSTLFKKETGMTLTEYVSKKRIDHAAFLLTSTNLQIQVVAQNCGIYDVNYFTKMFKKQTGKTPKEYRENALKF